MDVVFQAADRLKEAAAAFGLVIFGVYPLALLSYTAWSASNSSKVVGDASAPASAVCSEPSESVPRRRVRVAHGDWDAFWPIAVLEMPRRSSTFEPRTAWAEVWRISVCIRMLSTESGLSDALMLSE
eukprot:CAMPEP_0197886992 /NCGR_PEP_ID=MMETSP1439-20131203/18692_1 /TAXON_ID=66791 /ORGANISM="Gonyaulax spinifera, Strain CCMP409" /LENGTH=126 /DNA_ID=CAMNT_0043506815 /DNA_START=73 /DNA_END=451 /DNA_ORIENTATION=-